MPVHILQFGASAKAGTEHTECGQTLLCLPTLLEILHWVTAMVSGWYTADFQPLGSLAQ
jgi:hypothetical protein